MKFGSVAPREAVGAINVHAVRAGGVVLKKGAVISGENAAALEAAGVSAIVVARLEAGDLSEDIAAGRVATAAAGDGVRVDAAFTGRANLFAMQSGVLVVDRDAVDALNARDEAITLATLPAFAPVVAGEMVGTVKIIPFGVPEDICAEVCAALAERRALRVVPYRVRRVGVISTVLPGTPDKIITKTLAVTSARLAPTGASIVATHRVAHDARALAEALQALREAAVELILVFGASAIADRRDVIPAAIAAAGGEVEHFGMPVDPGNLMLVGRLAGIPVIGAPGCARSPSQNGFDWVLTRLIAGIAVARADVVRMGVGGLLKEIATRPQPRLIAETAVPSVAAVILAAGQSRRMGGPNKLLAPVAGTPVIRRVAEEAIAAGLAPVLVVTGHQQAEIAQALTGLAVRLVDNPDYREGIASSVRTGVAAVPEATQGALICLGDMPLADRGLFARMAAQFAPDHGALVVVPVKDGRRGNPVLWSRRFFPDLMQLSGDVGARHLLERYGDAVAEVEVADDGAFVDVDTPEALQAVQQRVPPGAQK